MPESRRRRVLLKVQKDKRRRLKDFFTRSIHICDTSRGRFRSGVKKDASNSGAGAKRDVLPFLNNGQEKIRGLRLCANHATEARAETAICAATARNPIGI